MRQSGENAGRDSEQQAVIRQLEEDIIFRRFRPGLRLVEDALMARYRASRHFIRQALLQMERLGIVHREKNVGATVASFSRDDVEQIYQVLELLIRQAVLQIDLPAPAALIKRLEALQAIHVASYDALDVRRAHETNDAFHFALFEACKNRYLVKSLRDYFALTLPMRAKVIVDRAECARSLKQHEQLIALMSGTDRWALAQLSIDHVTPSKLDYLGLIDADQ